MATFAKQEGSGSTDGRNIKVTSTTSGGADTLHTAVSGTSDYDEIWIYAMSSDSTDRLLTLMWGGTTDPDDYVSITVPAEGAGPVLVISGWVLQNSLIVKGFAATANVIMCHIFVNRITA